MKTKLTQNSNRILNFDTFWSCQFSENRQFSVIPIPLYLPMNLHGSNVYSITNNNSHLVVRGCRIGRGSLVAIAHSHARVARRRHRTARRTRLHAGGRQQLLQRVLQRTGGKLVARRRHRWRHILTRNWLFNFLNFQECGLSQRSKLIPLIRSSRYS